MQASSSLPGSPASLDLALIGNCQISALIDAKAQLVWCCMPRFDSTPVFDALMHSAQGIGTEGVFSVEIEQLARTEQHYEPGTAIVRTELWDTQGQGIEVVDFAPRFITRDRPYRPAQLVRRVRPLAGHPRVRFRVSPRGDWGRTAPTLTRGSHHLRYILPEGVLRLSTNVPLTYLVDQSWFSLHKAVSLLLGPDETLDAGIEETARSFEEQTSLYWRHWTHRLALPLEWQEAVIRAAITLKLCQFEETGAIVAAMTTSIPEAPNSGRNWDYRYCWIRDAFFVVRALNSLSEVGTMEGYLNWLYNVIRSARDGHVQPLYGIDLTADLPESVVEGVYGYRGMGPVRIGNQAYEHFQHDVYGSVVLGAAQAFHDMRLFRQADAKDFEALEAMGEQAWLLHELPDAGIWELRTRARIHTSSALMCWAACDRLAHVAQRMSRPERASLWRTRANAIQAKILARSWNEKRQAFVESFEGSDLDASVLLMGEVGFLNPQDPRFISTVRALESALCDGYFMRRYEGRDDFGLPETAFNVCTFWHIDALARTGRRAQARENFEAMLARRNKLGLLSEDLAPATGELWGNFPQTYSMVGIIHSAVRLSAPWDSMI